MARTATVTGNRSANNLLMRACRERGYGRGGADLINDSGGLVERSGYIVLHCRPRAKFVGGQATCDGARRHGRITTAFRGRVTKLHHDTFARARGTP